VLTERVKILVVGSTAEAESSVAENLRKAADLEVAATWSDARRLMREQCFDGVFMGRSGDGSNLSEISDLIRATQQIPQGVAIVDEKQNVLWANEQLNTWAECENAVGLNLYEALGDGEIIGGMKCPCLKTIKSTHAARCLIKSKEEQFYRVQANLMNDSDVASDEPLEILVFVQDVTSDERYRQKLNAIHEAGVELSNLSPEEVFQMDVQDRIELLKSNILHYTQSILAYDYVEIRLLDQGTGKLQGLLSAGIDQEAAERSLVVSKHANGVTGYVAATGESYLVEDVANDPLFIQSFSGAKSSLTVPLKWHSVVIGTFNVESPEEDSFSESDMHFLELFVRNIAMALNTLDLLVAQKTNAAQKSVEAIHREVALPIDKILNDAVNVMECYIGHAPEVEQRLRRILRNARDVRQVIHKIGQDMAPAEAVPPGVAIERHPFLVGQRVLVVDSDESVRNDAHSLLERFGCIVETAETGGEAVYMVRNTDGNESYNAIISDIGLPDFSGYQLMLRLQDMLDVVPLILMTGFGYDPGHSIVKARQAGLHTNAVLYKPFRLVQLLDVIETVLKLHGSSTSASGPNS
jgi:CheY-like chemotaxis protein/putative methionine-R-sulfoxide reductase with GAF domain